MFDNRKQHTFRRKWGQNFLTDKNLLDKIVKVVGPKNNEHFLEIGPGEGALTERVFPKVGGMVAIEIDPILVTEIKKKPKLEGLHILNGDILLKDIDDLPIKSPVRVIGNIPYNITSPILFWLIEQLDYWEDAYIMMQKEVAERLSASVNTKAYGRLTVVVGAYLDIEYCFTIKPDVFIPKPKVNSAIVHLTKKNPPLIDDHKYERFNKIVSAAFSQRRKMLRNTLKGWGISQEKINQIDFTRRPENLTIDEFVYLV